MKFWMINQTSQATVIATDFDNMEEAHQAAVNWNKECQPSQRVDVIMNAKTAREATRVSGVLGH